MFRQQIDLLPEIPDSLAKTIKEGNNVLINDNTAVMTIISLLYNRLDQIENFKFKGLTTTALNLIISGRPSLYIMEDADDDKVSSFLAKQTISNIKALEPYEKFIQDKIKKKFWIRIAPEINVAFIFASGSITLEQMHFVLSFFSCYFPSLFKDKPLVQEEIDYLRTLTLRDSNEYIKKLRVLLNTESFRKFSMIHQLAGFEKKIYKKRLNAVKAELEATERKMEQALEEYRLACGDRSELLITLTGLETMTEATPERTELQEYLATNKHICNLSISGDHIRFIVKTRLLPYLFDDYAAHCRSGYIFKELSGNVKTESDAKLLLDAIFSEDRCLQVKMCAYFDMNYFGNSVTSSIGYNFKDAAPELNDYIPNPHLNRHNCFGQNKADILENLTNGDIIGAVVCAINTAQRINISEWPSFRPFLENLYTTDGKCIVADNGTEMTVPEALEYLKGKQ